MWQTPGKYKPIPPERSHQQELSPSHINTFIIIMSVVGIIIIVIIIIILIKKIIVVITIIT